MKHSKIGLAIEKPIDQLEQIPPDVTGLFCDAWGVAGA